MGYFEGKIIKNNIIPSHFSNGRPIFGEDFGLFFFSFFFFGTSKEMKKGGTKTKGWGTIVGVSCLLALAFLFFVHGGSSVDEELTQLYQNGERLAYFDFTGSGLFTQTQIKKVADMLANRLYGNSHSPSPCARATELLIEEAREIILDWLLVEKKKQYEYGVAFTDGATEALRIVGEHFPWSNQSTIAYTILNHNSALGIREYVREKGGKLSPFRHETDKIPEPLNRTANNLLVFPAECNFSGKKIPLRLIGEAKRKGYRVMLDAAAYLPTNQLDLVESGADFVSMSFYKVFGYPTGLGALVVKRASADDFKKVYFGGGTVKTSFADPPVAYLYDSFEEKFEDGTRNFLSIGSIKFGFEELEKQGGMIQISENVWKMTMSLYEKLSSLTHPNGKKKVVIYGNHEKGPLHQGGVITFNILREDGSYVHFGDAETQIEEDGIVQLRTGCMCNPGGCYELTGVDIPTLLKLSEENKHVCAPESKREVAGVPVGAIRASLGWPTTEEDVKKLVEKVDQVV